VPVTARLSQKFYEALGEDVTNELVNWFNAVDATYRGDLRDLNESNFARFDARMGERVAELRAEMAQLETRLNTRLGQGMDRLGQVKSDLLKWMLTFWVSTLIGLGALFFRG
jgi:hypothetical protein